MSDGIAPLMFENSISNVEQNSNPNENANEKLLLINEELPYFIEKYAGKLCILCNLGERSHLGQGEMLRLQVTEDEQHLLTSCSGDNEKLSISSKIDSPSNADGTKFINKRQKGQTKVKNVNVTAEQNLTELQKVGFPESLELCNMLDSSGFFYVHRLCIFWSFGILRDKQGILKNVAEIVTKSLQQKCSYCNNFGASISCKMACMSYYHFPCVGASGGLQLIQNYDTFCKEHVIQAQMICPDTNICCQVCSEQGDITNLVMCSTCGDLFHGTCIGLPQIPDVRVGWQCKICSKCQICRVADNTEGRSLSCEQCHKLYHANCLRPIMTSIPKYGWKCRFCRVCSDCGSRTPGAGTSSRWHAHYTVCDSCYQQRNKGFSCPICHRAYRAAAYKEMVKCNVCNKFVHSTCDPEADLKVYHAKKENNPDYDYTCPTCSNHLQNGRIFKFSSTKQVEEEFSNSQDSNNCVDDVENDIFEKYSESNFGKGKPFSAIAATKRRLGFAFVQPNRGKGKCSNPKKQRFQDCGRKRGPKTKIRTTFGFPEHQRNYNENTSNKNEDEPGGENRLILCSAKDKFLLTQDICVMCGSIGTDHEGCLISCTQCGQCYHPYCVNVKITKVIIQKGWRCLDCTVCEGCGQKNDEARLILCDECDISFHIYCMDPPLEFVPQGHWKCKWCAMCQKCGRNNAGVNSTWKNSYSECGPCYSRAICAVCSINYNENDLIVKCLKCERWLHGACDGIRDKDDIMKILKISYHCVLCRPKNSPLPVLTNSDSSILNKESIVKQNNENSNDQISSESFHCIDGIILSDRGFNVIKSLQMEYKKKRKPKYFDGIKFNNKNNPGILDVIESVASGDVDKITNLSSAEELNQLDENNMYKDGMLWDGLDETPPKGFSICSNEDGVLKLKKKRQRNLQKLGIGGFVVRNRTLKKDLDIVGALNNNNSSKTNLPDIDKKKKSFKKKAKSRLSEIYPSYLQEAFFGKILLENEKPSNLESETSDEESKSNISEDKVLHFMHEQTITNVPVKLESNDDPPQGASKLNNMEFEANNKISDNQILNHKEKLTNQVEKINFTQNIKTNSYDCLKDVDQKSQILTKITKPNTINECNPYLYQDDDEEDHKNITKSVKLENKINYEDTKLELIEEKPFLSEKINQKMNTGGEESKNAAICYQERMRRDEELGEMATISAVLYANTKHAKLKSDYPVWNDRYKQIHKRWRSLSNENKAPFLQQARDNRSALRTKKAQQDQEKQKVFKDQERERMWKQHQAMRAKEQSHTSPNLKDNCSPRNEMNFLNPNELFDEMHDVNKKAYNYAESSSSMLNKQNIMTDTLDMNAHNNSNIKINTNDRNSKQLRNLLLKEKNNMSASFSDEIPIQFSTSETKKELLIKNRPLLNIKNEKTTLTIRKPKTTTMEDISQNRAKASYQQVNIKKDPEKPEQEENTGIGEVGDIFGGLVNDEDLLHSLTEEIGENFNILEYADPELDVLNDENNQHLFDKIDFHEENHIEKAKICYDEFKSPQRKGNMINNLQMNYDTNPIVHNNATKISREARQNEINCIVRSDSAENSNSSLSSIKSPPPYPLPPPYPKMEMASSSGISQQQQQQPPSNFINDEMVVGQKEKQLYNPNLKPDLVGGDNRLHNHAMTDNIIDRHISNFNTMNDRYKKAELCNMTPDMNYVMNKEDDSKNLNKNSVLNCKSEQSNSHGGGSIKNVIPILTNSDHPHRIKLGLFGGSPMWNITDIAKHSVTRKNLNINIRDAQIDNEATVSENQMDEYDDFNDKGIVTTEVSLNSVAQNITDNDDMDVIQSFASSELADIVASPLESEVAEEYVLFSSDVVDYTANDDCMRILTVQKNDNKNDINVHSELTPLKSEEFKSPNETIMKQSCVEIKSNVIEKPSISSGVQNSTVKVQTPFSGKSTKLLSSDLINPSTIQKLPEVIQSTSKVSIGNTTISVPLVKTVAYNVNTKNLLNTDQHTKQAKITKKPPTILNYREKKLDTSTITQTSSPKTIQTQFVNKNIKISNSEISPIINTTKPNLVHNFEFPKLSQLSVQQDVSLPSNIFEDESSSPKSLSSSAFSMNSNEIEKSPELKKNTSETPTETKDANLSGNTETNRTNSGEKNFTAVPQLSPLSQPTEMTTNMAHVSQQLRTIMSSINISPSFPPNKNVEDIKNIQTNLHILENSKKIQIKKTKNEIKIKKMMHKAPSEILTASISYDGTKSKSIIGTSLKRSKSTEEVEKELPAHITSTKRYSLEVSPKKTDIPEIKTGSTGTIKLNQTEHDGSDNKSSVPKMKSDDSQNVLLKQLLQSNASNGSNINSQPITCRKVTSLRAPSLGMVSSLEAQLARPSLPPVPADSQVLLQKKNKYPMDSIEIPKDNKQDNNSKSEENKIVQIITRETSFISNPAKTFNQKNNENLKLNNDVYNIITNTEKKHDVIESKPPPASSIFDTVKPTTTTTHTNKPIHTDIELNPTNTNSEIKTEKTIKKEIKILEPNVEVKKKKKVTKKSECPKYKKNISGKDLINSNVKKRGRKYSKIDEDYDSFIDSLMVQIRLMPSLQVLEPLLNRSYNICPIFGAADHSKTTDPQNDISYRNSIMHFDYYSSHPFERKKRKYSTQDNLTQNGFYDFEFPRIKTENKKQFFDRIENTLENRDLDSPDSYVASSSPECCNYDKMDVDYMNSGSMSPTIPKIYPISGNSWNKNNTLKAFDMNSMYNLERKLLQVIPPNDIKSSIMLTLTSSAAENILCVLQELATLLNIPSPNSYKIVEIDKNRNKSSSINSSKQFKGKSLQDIQSLVNGMGKFCYFCETYIKSARQYIKFRDIEHLLEKKLLVKSKKLYFCDKNCYYQFEKNYLTNNYSSSNDDNNRTKNNFNMNKNQLKSEENSNVNNNAATLEYHHFRSDFVNCQVKCKKPTDNEIVELLFKTGVTVKPAHKMPDDIRQCILCSNTGDGISDGTSRLLNYDVNQWVHLNCALWSDGVYETVNGGLMNLEAAINNSQNQTCSACNKTGATVKCFKNRCGYIYHLCCALKEKCVFYKNKTTFCYIHSQKNDKENELMSLSVQRRVYVERDESRQVAAVMHQSDITNMLRVGSLIFLNVGQLLPHQLQHFHSQNFIYPIGYKIIRFYWSMRIPNKRCRYICSILDLGGRPEFRVLIQESNEEDLEFKGLTPISVWQTILERIVALRKKHNLVQLFPKFVTGEDLFGLTEPTVVRILESLPGIDTLTDYRFKYGRNPLLELPLAVNPSGAARTEAKQKQTFSWKKSYTQRTSSSTNQRITLAPTVSIAGEVACPYSKQFVHSKSSQYKKMKLEWRNNVYLARSKIQGLGLYAARDLEKHTMVIEYIGEVIRTEVSEIREKQYEAKNRGIYMFRLDENRVVDATLSGGLARYINHSCNPNCVTEIVEVDREFRIIIFAKRRILRGEELSYDYKFDIEEDANKISCMCGAPSCKKWMN